MTLRNILPKRFMTIIIKTVTEDDPAKQGRPAETGKALKNRSYNLTKKEQHTHFFLPIYESASESLVIIHITILYAYGFSTLHSTLLTLSVRHPSCFQQDFWEPHYYNPPRIWKCFYQTPESLKKAELCSRYQHRKEAREL